MAIVFFIITMMLCMLLLVLTIYKASTMPHMKRVYNNQEIAKKIIEKEITKFEKEYRAAFGETSPYCLLPIENLINKKSENTTIIFLLGPTLHVEKEQDKEKLINILSNKNIKVYKYHVSLSHHFRICDDGYAYVERKHEPLQAKREALIFRNNKDLIQRIIRRFGKLVECAELVTDPLNKFEIIADTENKNPTFC